MDGYKQVGEHHPQCHSQHHEDGITFIVFEGYVWDPTMWSRFACNDTRCGAEMLVRWDTLARCINASVMEARS